MTSNRSPAVYELEREIALLPVEDKLWLQAQIDRQIKSAALGESSSSMVKDPKISEIITLGLMVYTADGLKDFLNTPLPVFDKHTAIDLICVGEHDRVIGALAADFEGLGY
jgi:hypothetical protein